MDIAESKVSEEKWKSPPSLKQWWVEVSSFGNVRHLSRQIPYTRSGKSFVRKWMRIDSIKGGSDIRGRRFITIFLNKKPHIIYIDDLVAECFLGRQKGEGILVHLDGEEKNCRVENLRILKDRHALREFQNWKSGRIIYAFEEGAVEPRFAAFSTPAMGRLLGVSKQAIFHALITKGARCRGYEIRDSLR